MKITSITFLLASLVGGISAQNQDDTCLDLQTSCVTIEGTSCRFIKQQKADKCGLQTVTLKANWCNNTGKHQRITTESALKLTGGAIGGQKVLPVPTGLLSRGECDEEEWTFQINNCKQFFNYEVNIKTANSQCRGFFFTRQMKTLCKAGAELTCTLPNGTSCANYNGPPVRTIAEPNCPVIKCIDQPEANCKQNLNYGFTIRNREDQPLDFDLDSPQIANSKVAWKIVETNNNNFADLSGDNNRSWSKTQTANICRVIPSASINIRGNISNAKRGYRNEKDPDYQFCFKYVDQKVRKFDNGTKLPFCSDVAFGQPPRASAKGKGKGKGGKGKGKGGGEPPVPPLCPVIVSQGNDEL
jgi:hypothetical protein